MWTLLASAIVAMTSALEHEIFDEPPVFVFDLPRCGSPPSSTASVREATFSWDGRGLRCKQVAAMRRLLPAFEACHRAALAADPDDIGLYYSTIDFHVRIEHGRSKRVFWWNHVVGPKLRSCFDAAIAGATFAGRDGLLTYSVDLREP